MKIKQTLLAGLLLLAATFSCRMYRTETAFTRERYDMILSEFFDWWWRTHPVSASQAGLHEFDGLLDETGKEAVEARISGYNAYYLGMLGLKAQKLKPEQRLERECLLAAMEARLFDLETLKPYERNPLQYINRLGTGLQLLLDDSGGPMSTSRQHLSERLSRAPEYLKGAREVIYAPPAEFTLAAIDRCRGLERLVRSLAEETAGPVSSADPIGDEARKALEALTGFRDYLERDILIRSTGDFRLGSDRYTHSFRLIHQTTLSPKDLLSWAEYTLDMVREEIFEIAYRLHLELFPEKKGDPGGLIKEEGRIPVVRAVLKAVAGNHPRPEDYPKVIWGSLEEIRAFIEAEKLIDLPKGELPPLSPVPEYARGFSLAYYEPESTFDPLKGAAFRYSPVPENWSAEDREAFMSEFNRYRIRLLTMQEILPGRFIQSVMTDEIDSAVRHFFGNGACREGWAEYSGHLMVEAGFDKSDPPMRLIMLHQYLRSVMSAILDIRLHTEKLEDKEAIPFLVDGAYLNIREARTMLQGAKLTHVAPTMRFYGYLQLMDLRNALAASMGSAFSMKRFHRSFLNYGPMPLDFIRDDLIRKAEN